MPETFYRVLTTVTKPIWEAGSWNSSHNGYPTEWELKWKETQSTNYDDYPLTCGWGRHTEAARKLFVDTAVESGGLEGPLWKQRLRRIGELDGALAWSSPAGAHKYVSGDGSPLPMYHLEHLWVLEFPGDNLNLEIPEKFGGVQVTVLGEGEILTALNFAAKHGLEFTIEDYDDNASGLVDLPFPEDDEAS